MSSSGSINRRDFLLRAAGRSRVVEMSCGCLYMRYGDARSAGSLPQLIQSLELELRTGDEVRSTGREWLALEDIRRDVEPLLRMCDA